MKPGTLFKFKGPFAFEQEGRLILEFFGGSVNFDDHFVVCETQFAGNLEGVTIIRNIQRSEILRIEELGSITTLGNKAIWCFFTTLETDNYEVL